MINAKISLVMLKKMFFDQQKYVAESPTISESKKNGLWHSS